MKPETLAKLRAKLNLAADVKDEDVAEKAAALALADPPPDKTAEVTALSARVQTLEKERDAAKGEAETLRLSATPKPADPVLMAMYGDVIGGKREAAVANGNVSEARAKEFDAILQDADGKPTALALSACGAKKRPLAFELWDTLAKPDEGRILAGNKVLRLAAGPHHTSYGDKADDDGKPVTKERLAELAQMAGVNLQAFAAAK